MKIRNKTLCVLEALFKGYRIKLDDGGLIYEFYWNGILCVDFENQIGGVSKPHPVGFDMSLVNFVKMCEKKTDDEIFIINANMILTKINKDRNGKGERK